MKPTLRVPAIVAVLVLAADDRAIGQSEAAKSTARLALSPREVERAAKAARNTNRLLGSLLKVTSRDIDGRYLYREGTWWYWMPQGYWVIWDGERWTPYRQ